MTARTPRILPLLAVLSGLLAAAPAALAHHGWAWTSDEWFELTGTVTAVYIGNPHATLTLEAKGESWDVDLAPLSRTLDAGFDENAAAVGDDVTVIGHRSEDPADTHMKAVRVIVGPQAYDVYPGRAAEYDA